MNSTQSSSLAKSNIVLCEYCDHAVMKCHLTAGVRALCPRCNSALYDTPYCSINGVLALCLTALILYFPANFYPVIEIQFLGNMRTTTVIQAAIEVCSQGFWVVGIAVLIAAVIAPGILIFSTLIQVLIVKYGLKSRIARKVLKQLLCYHPLIQQMSMLEIYVLALLVCDFQLTDFSKVTFGIGTFCFTMLFVVTIFMQREYKIEHMWEQVDD